jgi:hypothetical protein
MYMHGATMTKDERCVSCDLRRHGRMYTAPYGSYINDESCHMLQRFIKLEKIN